MPPADTPGTMWAVEIGLKRRRGTSYITHWFFVVPLAMVKVAAIAAVLRTPLVEVSPMTACEEFAGAEGLQWHMEDCLDVWSQWVHTVNPGLHRAYHDRNLLKGLSDDMRKRGTPCLVRANATADGAGSSTIRHMATWMFAKEIGCDWVTPDWGNEAVEGHEEVGATWYCHDKRMEEDASLDSMTTQQTLELERCFLVSWLHFFHFDIPSVRFPVHAVDKTVQTKPLDSLELKAAVEEAQQVGLDNVPWNRLVLNFHPMVASRFLLAIGGWDAFKRSIVRSVLREMRQNFHASPRPWYNPSPICDYDNSRLNFAIHVRLGDRRGSQYHTVEYFALLDLFMSTVGDLVQEMGLKRPLFHVFTETLHPCPSPKTGLFKELPIWPVAPEQVPQCLDAKIPSDCPEKRFGGKCFPDRPGIFHVLNRPLVLHVGEDVSNALQCMTQADGVLMGCSAFGQLAGLLTNGISMFSTSCHGIKTPEQYKMIPPLAISEMGELWVPVEGSWRDPRLTSLSILRKALHKHVESKFPGMR